MVFGLECQQKMVEKSSMPGEQRVEKGLPFRECKSSSFGKSERLLLKSEFSAVFRTPTGRFSTNSLRTLYRKNDLGLSRLGIIIPKRVVRLATARNRHKRLIKEQYRRIKECLPNVDIVVLLNKKVCEEELILGCDRTWKFFIFEVDD